MSTNIFENERITVTRFSGGSERGVCYQITEQQPFGAFRREGVVAMTLQDVEAVAVRILQDITSPIGRKFKRGGQ